MQDVLTPQISCSDGVKVTIGDTFDLANGPVFAPFSSGRQFSHPIGSKCHGGMQKCEMCGIDARASRYHCQKQQLAFYIDTLQTAACNPLNQEQLVFVTISCTVL